MRILSLCLLICLLWGCTAEHDESISECFQLPAGTHLPRLTQSPDDLYLSYVSSSKSGGDTLLIAKANLPSSDVQVVFAYGKDWFVNWADFPSVAYVDETVQHGPELFYHFLQYSAEGTYDYDVMYGIKDGSGPVDVHLKLHQDTVSAEHGFLSSVRIPEGDLQVSWLDGRYTKSGADAGAGEETEEHGHGSGGAMTLRTKALSDSVSVELDNRVCDCCNTATIATDSLIMVAYRDRSEHEIRDIAYVTKPISGNEWSTPKLVHADNWEISGCPVNGPALAANGRYAAAAWYTAANERPTIKFSWFNMLGQKRFSSPTILDDKSPLGRVDVQLGDNDTAYVTGLTATENPDSAALTLWTIDMLGNVDREQLAITSAARSSGFPKIALFQDKFYWVRAVLGAEKGEQFVEVCWR